jgi:tRNA threonylcarbamoyl adenosine modification protein YeaZ
MPDCILAIDTSTPRGSVAVVDTRGAVRYQHSFSSERSHNSQLFAPLREALDACGDGLLAIVVGTGPASYTGVRIGIAAAQGIAMSRGVSLIGLPSVLAPEVDDGSKDFVVCGDARRGSFFVAEVSQRALVKGVVLMDAEQFRERHAARASDTPWYAFDVKPPLALDGVVCVSPSAVRLAEIAAGLPENEMARLASLPLEPVYLAAAYVTQPKSKV